MRSITVNCRTIVSLIVLAITPTVPAHAAIVTVDPFTGDVTENYNQYSTNMAVQSLPVFGGAGTIQNLSASGSIKVEFSSTFQGHQVVPISGMMNGQLGIAQWVFNQPITCFGGWFENNSGADDATLTFFDISNSPIQTVIANIPFAKGWTWNGWSSDTPISRILVSGNGIVNGFLWYDNMQIDFADLPAPPASALISLVLLRRSRKRRVDGETLD